MSRATTKSRSRRRRPSRDDSRPACCHVGDHELTCRRPTVSIAATLREFGAQFGGNELLQPMSRRTTLLAPPPAGTTRRELSAGLTYITRNPSGDQAGQPPVGVICSSAPPAVGDTQLPACLSHVRRRRPAGSSSSDSGVQPGAAGRASLVGTSQRLFELPQRYAAGGVSDRGRPSADRGIDQGIPRVRSTSRGVILMRSKEKGDRR